MLMRTNIVSGTSASTNLSGNKNVQKVDGNPGEPGGSLPVGDGVWLMLSMLAFYGLFSTKLYLLLARLIGIMHWKHWNKYGHTLCFQLFNALLLFNIES